MAKSKEQKDKEHAEALAKAKTDEATEAKTKADSEKAELDAKAKAKADSKAAAETELIRAEEAEEIRDEARRLERLEKVRAEEAIALAQATPDRNPANARVPESADMDDFLDLLLAAGLDFKPTRDLNLGEMLACEEWANKTIDEMEKHRGLRNLPTLPYCLRD